MELEDRSRDVVHARVRHDVGEMREESGRRRERQWGWGERLLTNDVYIGVSTFGIHRTGFQKHKPADPIRTEDAHEGLVTKEEFARVQTLLADRAPDIVSENVLAGDYLLSGLTFCTGCGSPYFGHNARSGSYRYYVCQKKKKLGAESCTAKPLPKTETEAAVIDLLEREVLSPRYLRDLLLLVNEESLAANQAADADAEAMKSQLAEGRRRLDNLYRAVEDGAMDLGVLAPRIREVKASVDELTLRHARLTAAATAPAPYVADEATIALYVERLKEILATGTPNAQRAFLRAWISRIDADGMKLTVTFTLPADLGGNTPNQGQNSSRTKVLPRVLFMEAAGVEPPSRGGRRCTAEAGYRRCRRQSGEGVSVIWCRLMSSDDGVARAEVAEFWRRSG